MLRGQVQTQCIHSRAGRWMGIQTGRQQSQQEWHEQADKWKHWNMQQLTQCSRPVGVTLGAFLACLSCRLYAHIWASMGLGTVSVLVRLPNAPWTNTEAGRLSSYWLLWDESQTLPLPCHQMRSKLKSGGCGQWLYLNAGLILYWCGQRRHSHHVIVKNCASPSED